MRSFPGRMGQLTPSGLVQRSPLRRPPRPAVWAGVGPRPCVPPPSAPVDPESSASISIAPASTSFLSPGWSMSCADICPLFRGPRCNVLPRGRGMLSGFPVLLVTAAMVGSSHRTRLPSVLPRSLLGVAVGVLLRLRLGGVLGLCDVFLLLAALFRLG